MTTLRPLISDDLQIICRHRHLMFAESGKSDDVLAAAAGPFSDWLKARLDTGLYYGFIAEDDGQPVGGIGLMTIDWPPHPAHPTDPRRGYVLNVYVEPDYRGAGLARKLMEAADAEFLRRGLHYAILHTTKMGRPLYERLNWNTTTEMAKAL
jgi:GNAT superfamily N-acetyltransferase